MNVRVDLWDATAAFGRSQGLFEWWGQISREGVSPLEFAENLLNSG